MESTPQRTTLPGGSAAWIAESASKRSRRRTSAIATMYFDLGRNVAQGSIMALAFTGPSGSIWSAFTPDTTIFSLTLTAGQYSIIGQVWNIAPSAGDYMNEAWMTGSISAVPVPAPGVIAALGLAGLGRPRRRR